MGPWKRIGVALKAGQGDMAPLLQRVVSTLREDGVEVVLEREAASHVDGAEALTLEQVAGRAELFIVLGGDGTVLAAARAIGGRSVPILGINLGQLGFLADVHPREVDTALAALLRGECGLEERGRLEVTALVAEGEVAQGLALNDAVISNGPDVARLINLETRVDGKTIATYVADGLVISTPTGSTAYNLSAGGPIVAPAVPAVILTPICPHALSQRPLVVADTRAVEVRLHSGAPARLTLDGQVGRELQAGDGVRVRRAAHPIGFVTFPDRDYFATLRTKLGWGAR